MRFDIPAAALLAATGSLLFANFARAETFGSQTKVSIAAVYTLPGTQNSTNFPSGAYRSTSEVDTIRYGNREILETLVRRGLIGSIKGYSIVMLRTGLGTHSYTFVAAHATQVNVRVPDDLLSLSFGDGPRKSRYAYNPQGIITELAYETHDLATLKLDGFEGQSVLLRKSGRKNITRNGETHTIKLDSAKATFDGSVSLNSLSGVGTVTLQLSDAKVVTLDSFGAAAPTGEEDEPPVGELSLTGSFSGATLTLGSSFLNDFGGYTFMFTETTGDLTVSSIGDATVTFTTP